MTGARELLFSALHDHVLPCSSSRTEFDAQEWVGGTDAELHVEALATTSIRGNNGGGPVHIREEENKNKSLKITVSPNVIRVPDQRQGRACCLCANWPVTQHQH